MFKSWPHSTKDGLVLYSSKEDVSPQLVYNDNVNIGERAKYTQGKVDGSDSYYIVYSVENFNVQNQNVFDTSVVVDSNQTTEFGLTAVSAQGYDKSGIVLFEHGGFCGQGKLYTTSNPDITGTFPPHTKGVSSFIVHKGWWSLYTQKDYSHRMNISGQTKFGPGSRVNIPTDYNDKMESIKYFPYA